jgi:alcohol dehydrogenase class IV
LRKAIGIDQTLGEIGLSSRDIPELAGKAMQDACMVTNPRRPVQRDIEVIYEEAF